MRVEDGVGGHAALARGGEGDAEAPFVGSVAAPMHEASPFEVLDDHRRAALGQAEVARQIGQRNSFGRGYVLEKCRLVLAEVRVVGSPERAEDPSVSLLKSCSIRTIHNVDDCGTLPVMDESILDALSTSNRVTLYILDAIPEDALGGVAASKGRSVGAMLAHLHNMRLMWFDAAAKDLAARMTKIEKDQVFDRELLRSSLEASSAAMEELVRRALDGGRIVGFKRSPAAFVGYLVAHEGYHWGEIGMTLNSLATH